MIMIIIINIMYIVIIDIVVIIIIIIIIINVIFIIIINFLSVIWMTEQPTHRDLYSVINYNFCLIDVV